HSLSTVPLWVLLLTLNQVRYNKKCRYY
ncbi:hypothetical protein, partial [Vibrio parahaemolyticus]